MDGDENTIEEDDEDEEEKMQIRNQFQWTTWDEPNRAIHVHV